MIPGGVIFDLGRVLVGIDLERGLFRKLARLPEADADAVIAQLVREPVFRAFNRGEIDAPSFHQVVTDTFHLSLPYDDFVACWCGIFVEQSGMRALVEEVGTRARLGLLSDTDPLHWQYITAHNDWIAAIPAPTLSYETGVMKPEPEAFRLACANIGLPPSSCIYVDDLQENVDGARAVGLDALRFTSVGALREALQERGICGGEAQ